MGFRADLIRWVQRKLAGRVTDEELRKLLRGYEVGQLVPVDRAGLPPEFRQWRPALIEEEIPEIPPGSWIYYPISDTAPYSWGEPYTTELGTVLAGVSCVSSALAVVDASKRPYRLYDGGADTVTHGTDQMAGRHYWKHDDYVITWGAVLGHESRSEQFTDNENRSIYYNGAPLVESFRSGFDNPMEVVGAGIRHDAGTNYLFMSSSGQGTGAYLGRYLLQRTPINPYAHNPSPDWYFSLNLESILSALTPPFNTAVPIISTAFNKSCTRMIINQPGRVVEVDISGAWGSETIVKDDYFGNKIDLGNIPTEAPYTYGPATGEIHVISGFEPDSDIRRDLTIEISHPGYTIATPHDICQRVLSKITATLKENGDSINTWTLHEDRIEWAVELEESFITLNPFFQDIQGRIYTVDHLRTRRQEDDETVPDAYLRRYHKQEVYRNGELFYSRDLVENHPNPTGNPASLNFQEFMWTGGRNTRDMATYPQCNRSQFQRSWIWIISENVITSLLGECIGYHLSLPSSGEHGASGFFTSADMTYEPTFGSVRYNGLNHIAFAANWDGSFILSRRVFDDWNGLRDPKWEWINVGTVDLLQKTGAVGDNQRLMVRGCNTQPSYLKPNLQQVGVYHSSSATPFPP